MAPSRLYTYCLHRIHIVQRNALSFAAGVRAWRKVFIRGRIFTTRTMEQDLQCHVFASVSEAQWGYFQSPEIGMVNNGAIRYTWMHHGGVLPGLGTTPRVPRAGIFWFNAYAAHHKTNWACCKVILNPVCQIKHGKNGCSDVIVSL